MTPKASWDLPVPFFLCSRLTSDTPLLDDLEELAALPSSYKFLFFFFLPKPVPSQPACPCSNVSSEKPSRTP